MEVKMSRTAVFVDEKVIGALRPNRSCCAL
jgi:hypothetical protein